jgi:hypothetical protein
VIQNGGYSIFNLLHVLNSPIISRNRLFEKLLSTNGPFLKYILSSQPCPHYFTEIDSLAEALGLNNSHLNFASIRKEYCNAAHATAYI